MLVSLLLGVALVSAPQDPVTPPHLAKRLKAPYTMAEDVKKFFPRRTGTPTSVRLRQYDRRLEMEKASTLQGITWRNVGPEMVSGRVLSIHTPKNHPEDLHVAFATGGLWRTKDWGETWESIFEGQSSFGIGDFVISNDGNTIYVGTGEANSQRTSYQGTGVFKSTDKGKTWANVGLAETNHIGAMAMHPTDPNTVFVAALGRLYTVNEERGLFRTKDGGKTWQNVLKLGEITGVVDVVIDPKNPNNVYAAAWERERRAWDFRDAGPSSAVYKSSDGGTTWRKLEGGLPSGDIGRIGLSVAASNPNVVYAFIDNWNADPDVIYDDEFAAAGVLTAYRFLFLNEEQFASLDKKVVEAFVSRYLPTGTKPEEIQQQVKEGKMKLEDVATLMEKRNPNVFEMDRVTQEIYRSDNGGKTWKRTHAYRFGSHGGYYWGKVRVNPHDENDVWTLGVLLLRSKDGGKTWRRTGQGTHVDYHDIYFDPTRPERIVMGNDGGPYVSKDGGENWRHMNNIPVCQTTTLAVDMKVPYNIYVGMQDNGTAVGPSTYVPGRSPLTQWKSIGGGDGSWIAVDPRDDGDLVYIASQFGAHNALNQKTNQRWGTVARAKQGEPAERYNWISPLIISPHHPDILYLGSQRVHRSFNQGRNWTAISPDLTKNRPEGDVPHSTVKVLDESPLRFGLIYAGTDDGKVMMTPDGGVTWTDISTPENDKWVSRVLASRWDENTVYVTQTGYRDDDYRAIVWKSTDRGKTWTSIVGDLPEGFVNSIKEDPVQKGWLYVATGLGVWMSMNGGENWVSVGGNLPRCAVHDIVIHPREMDLVAATHGKSVWVVNLRPVHALTEEIRKKFLHLFDPNVPSGASGWALRRRSNWDADLPAEPEINGWLWTQAGGQGTIKLTDKDGKVVKEKSFAGVPGLQRWSMDMLLKPGADRFAVDPKTRKRKTVEEILGDPFAAERAQYVVAGEYTLSVSVGTHTIETKMTIR